MNFGEQLGHAPFAFSHGPPASSLPGYVHHNYVPVDLNGSLGEDDLMPGHGSPYDMPRGRSERGGSSYRTPPRGDRPQGGSLSMDSTYGSATLCQPTDQIHTAMMSLAESFPVVHSFERINQGFYRVDGHGSCELSMARNSDKLFVKLDNWNRGARGELVKFLQTISSDDRPPSRTPSETNAPRRVDPRGARSGSPRRPSPRAETRPLEVRPSEARPSDARASRAPAGSPTQRSPMRRKAGCPPPKTHVPKSAGTPGVPRKGTAVTPRNSATQSSLSGFASRFKEGSLFVHVREPLLGDSMVLLRSIDPRDCDSDSRILMRLLSSGRTVEAAVSSLALLDHRPQTRNTANLAAFKEVFLLGNPEEMSETDHSVFGHVELGDLNSQRLGEVLSECWPQGSPSPVRGLAWALRPFLLDWIKRRQRLSNFMQLVVALPSDCLRVDTVPTLQDLLLDLSERDLFIATVLVTPLPERSRLYGFAAETRLPLPMVFPAVQCPYPPPESASDIDHGVCVQWEAFEALLARSSERPMMLWLGAQGCVRAGKSALLKEVLGFETITVEGSDLCHSPMHQPGVDLIKATAPLEWVADVHGSALGDPAWMALLSTLASASSLICMHLSLEDFVLHEEHPPERRTPAPNRPRRASPTVSSQQQQQQQHSLNGSSAGETTEPRSVRITAKPDVLAMLRICADARLPGVSAPRTRVTVLLRDVGKAGQQMQELIHAFLEGFLGNVLTGLFPVPTMTSLVGGRRTLALTTLRSQLQLELQATVGHVPCIDTLRRIYRHFFDRLTLAGEQPVLGANEFVPQTSMGEVLTTLLDEADSHTAGQLSAVIFPVSEAATQYARLKAQEKRLLDESADDVAIAELAAELRALEQSRRAMLQQPLSAPVHFFLEAVLPGQRLRHAKVVEFGQHLASWSAPRMAPLIEHRRSLLDERLQLGPGTTNKDQLASIGKRLVETEQALEQLSISVDLFWGELAAVSDLASELAGKGLRPTAGLPDSARLKSLFGEWVWNLNLPVQLLHGSPLQCAGQFLVEVLKDLGAKHTQELYVISVIGVQSSAKSTLLNYLFGCGFATSAGRCTRGLYCSLMECHGRTLLLLDTEGLMSLEADGGDVFDAQLALMAMASSHLVLINHKGELSRQLQDLLEVCLFAMQHLKVCRIQPKLLFVLRDQHDRSTSVHGDALRLMRKHLADASNHLQLRLEELISLDPGSVYLLPSAYASDLNSNTGTETKWATTVFANEALRLRQKIFSTVSSAAGAEGAPEFSTLPDWCLHAMSVWRVLDRYGPNLLHYKTIQEIEMQRELEDLVKQISTQLVHGPKGLAEQGKILLTDFTQRLHDGAPSEQVDAEFRSSLQAVLDQCSKRCLAELERCLQSRKTKLTDARKVEVTKKLQMPVEYQGELTRYTWALSLTDAVDRDQLRALKVHFKRTIEEMWQAQQAHVSEEQARQIFACEWSAFENKCRARFEKTTKSRKQLAEEVSLVFNHTLRQHRHSSETLHVLELVPVSSLLNETAMTSWDGGRIAKEFLEVRQPALLADYAHHSAGKGAPRGHRGDPLELVVSELQKRVTPAMTFEIPDGSTQLPPEDTLLKAMHQLNEVVKAEEDRFLAKLGVRFQGGRVAFLNAAHLCLRQSAHNALVEAEEGRVQHQWQTLQSHKQHTEEEFIIIVQKHTTDAGRAKTLASLFFDALAREWLDETLVVVAADIRAQCLADMPDASGAAERAYQQSFVERNWEDVLEYVLDVNAYLHKIFSNLFEDRKVSITRVQRPRIAAQLGGLFDSLTGAAHRWSHREQGASKLSSFQATLRTLAAEARAGDNGSQAWLLLSERFPVVADFHVENPARWAHEFRLNIASLLGEAKVEGLVAEKLEAALQKQQAQVWALIRGCSAMCPCCGSKCDRVDVHTEHKCSHHLLPAFNGWRVAGTCEAALDTCKSFKNHEAPKRSDYSDHLFPNLEEYLKAEHPEWLPFPKEDRELLADSVLKAAWTNCRAPLLHRFDMVDSTPAEWIEAYEEPHRKVREEAMEHAEDRLRAYGYSFDGSES